MKKLLPLVMAALFLAVCLVVVGRTAPPVEVNVRKIPVPVPGTDAALTLESIASPEREPLPVHITSDRAKITESHTRMVNIQGNGSVIKNPDQTAYVCGTKVRLTAYPDPGWDFANWSGDLISTANPVTITIDSNKVVTATFQDGNHPPIVTNVAISPISPTDDSDLTLSYVYDDPDDDPEGDTLIRWTRNGQLQSAFNDQKVASSNATLPGDRWCAAVTPHDGSEYGDTVEGVCVYIEYQPNTPPSAISVTISPSDPSAPPATTARHPALAGQICLTVAYGYHDDDGDDQSDPLQIRWYRNDKLQPALNDQETVPCDEIYPGEAWYATVRVHDGKDYGDPVNSNQVGVANAATGNHIPTVLTATIEPAEPENSDDLHLTYVYTDTDGDPEGDTLLRWYRNGMLEPSYNDAITIPAEYTLPGDEWYATVRPHDGEDYGLQVETNLVQVSEPAVNTEPWVVDVHIEPADPGDDDDLNLVYRYVDTEDDTEGDTLILWYKVGRDHLVLQEDYSGLSTIPASETSSDETWFAKVVPHDGEDYGIVVATHSVTVGEEQSNIPPKALDVYLAPDSPGPDDSLTLYHKYYDANDDPEAETKIQWTMCGNPGGYEGRTTIPAFATAIDQTWCGTVTPHDGIEYGEPVSDCVTITDSPDNAPPEAQDAYIEPGRPSSNQNLWLRYTPSDPDGDAQGNTLIHWYQNDELEGDFDGWIFIPAAETEPGQEWYAIVTPHDGIEYGTPITTPIVTINHRPRVVVAGLTFRQLQARQVLSLTYVYEDEDGDPEAWSWIHWYCNDEHRPEYDDETSVPASDTSIGEKWYVKMAVHDGVEYGDETKSYDRSVEEAHCLVYLPALARNYPPPSLDLTCPDGGESWKPYTTQTIMWKTTGSVPRVSLFYSTDDFLTSHPIALGITNTGSYDWIIPNDPTDHAQVRIVSVDISPTVWDDSSGDFTIEDPPPPSLTLTNPTGGEIWTMGSTQQIQWDHSGHVPKVNLTYSTDDFDTEHVIAEIVNTGSYTWTVPLDPTFFAQVRVASVTDPSVQDTSDYFTIGCDKSKYWEENDAQIRACPLYFDEDCDAYPEDENDWYYVYLTQTASLNVVMTNYFARGQVIVYPYNPDESPPRDASIANDGRRWLQDRELPNEILPHALDHLKGRPAGSGLPPGRYYIRVYSADDLTTGQLYHLITTYQPIEH